MQAAQKQYLDYFKLFKILELKKLEKHGQVKLQQDKILSRKILAVEGNVSTHNYINFQTNTIRMNNPSILFNQKYLYLVAYAEPSKNFCFLIVLQCNTKTTKFLFSTLYKTEKVTANGVIQMPISLKNSIWTILVIDLFDLCDRIKGKSQQRISSRIESIEIRAHSKIKNIYQSDYLFDPYSLPKEMELPLKGNQNFYEKYNYAVMGSHKINKQNISELSNQKTMNIPQATEYNLNIAQKDTKQSQQQKPSKSQKNQKNQKKTTHKKLMTSLRNSAKIPNKSTLKQSKQIIGSFLAQQDDSEDIPRTQIHPKPQVTISAQLVGLQGNTIFSDNIITLQSFVIFPTVFAVHKSIRCLSVNRNNPFEVVFGYQDGSISIWDIIRQKTLGYIKTQITKIKTIKFGVGECDNSLYMVGTDSKKRQIIMIITNNQISYQKVSTFPISNLFLPSQTQSFITYGYENIRIWKPNPQNNILNGTSIYLGKMNMKVHYKACCQISEDIIYVVDSCGYLTQVDVSQQKTIEICKIHENQLDHIVNIEEMRRIVVVDGRGVCKMMDYQLNVEEEFQFGNRVRSICYRVDKSDIVLKLENYNKSLAEFNISTGCYKYLMRSHSQPITKIQYMSKIGKIVTISKDNTIRIWNLTQKYPQSDNTVKYDKKTLDWSITEEYELVVQTGEMGTLMVADQQQYAYIVLSNNKVMKIDVCSFKVLGEVSLPMLTHEESQEYQGADCKITGMQISKNGRNLLFCIEKRLSENIYGACVLLTDSNLNILSSYECPLKNPAIIKEVSCRFNYSYKKYILIWSANQQHRIHCYSLNQPNTIKSSVHLSEQQKPKNIFYNNQQIIVELLNTKQHYLQFYNEQTGNKSKIYNIGNTNSTMSLQSQQWNSCCVVQYPFLVQSNKREQLSVSLLLNTKKKIQESVELPESVSNFQLIRNICLREADVENRQNYLVLCSGVRSYGLYAVQFQVNNLGQFLGRQQLQQIQYNKQRHDYQKSCGSDRNQFMGGISSISGNTNYMNFKNQFICKIQEEDQDQFMGEESDNEHEQIMQISQQLKQIRGLYHQHQQLFQQVQDAIYGNYFQNNQHEQHHEQYHEQHHEAYNPQKYQQNQQNQGLSLIYGWQPKYPNISNPILLWNPQSQSLLLYNSSCRAVVLHYFKEPVHQKIIHLPIQPAFITELAIRNNGNYITKDARFIGIGLGNQLKIYDSSLNYSKTLVAIGTAILDASISLCSNFIIILSNENNKIYIEIVDLVTTNTISSTYLHLQSYSAIKLLVNPFQTCLQFMLYTERQVFFYRLTSILTLQMQQLPKIIDIVHDYSGQITCAEYAKLSVDGQELILFGTANGSIVLVDGRAAQILIVCKQLVNRMIINILYNVTSQQEGYITLTTKSNTVTFYKLNSENSLNNLIAVLQATPTSQLTIDSQISSHSYVHQLSSSNGTLGMLALSKFGCLWLIDLLAKDTIKVLSSHTRISNKLKTSEQPLISQVVPLPFCQSFLTGATDGYVKLTSLSNLQQQNQIFKPKRKVKDIIYISQQFNSLCDLLVVAFNSQIFFYKFQHTSSWKFLGVVRFASEIVRIQHIRYSNNFIVCGVDQVALLYVGFREKFIAEIRQICEGLSHPLDLEVSGYNLMLVRQINKIDVWIRKTKRGEDTLKQLSQNIHEVKYYMMDSYQCAAGNCEFLTNQPDQTSSYLCLLLERPLIQFRDFEQHSILREIQLPMSSPLSMLRTQEQFYVGDESGYLYVINENGLQMEKIKVFSGPLKNMVHYHQYSNKNSSMKNKLNKIIAYGESVAIIHI